MLPGKTGEHNVMVPVSALPNKRDIFDPVAMSVAKSHHPQYPKGMFVSSRPIYFILDHQSHTRLRLLHSSISAFAVWKCLLIFVDVRNLIPIPCCPSSNQRKMRSQHDEISSAHYFQRCQIFGIGSMTRKQEKLRALSTLTKISCIVLALVVQCCFNSVISYLLT